MKRRGKSRNPANWRPIWLALPLVALCSCRSPQTQIGRIAQPVDQAAAAERVPRGRQIERAIEPTANIPRECVANTGLPIPNHLESPWIPPGIAGPWPHDEYLEDGGDREVQVNLGPNGELRGLELEDTVVMYDTAELGTCIVPSNRVCLYAPRFAAVRKVQSIVQNQQTDQIVAARMPVRAYLQRHGELATAAVQPMQPEGEIGAKQASIERVGEGPLPAIGRQPIAALDGGFAIYENFRAIRHGIFEASEKARLMEAIDAAILWTHDQAVQVVLDGRQAVDVVGNQKAQATFSYESDRHPCLRVIKVASTKVAKPGDVVDFTIRFDNQGDTELKHVVLVDNLTTRLEYVEGTAQSSRDAQFSTETNEGESLVLRWEFADPLPIGQGGLVRFHCRVR